MRIVFPAVATEEAEHAAGRDREVQAGQRDPAAASQPPVRLAEPGDFDGVHDVGATSRSRTRGVGPPSPDLRVSTSGPEDCHA